MRLTWADQLPAGISVQSEEEVLTRIEQVAQEAGFPVSREPSPEYRDRAEGDLLVETPEGLLLFEARRKSNNLRARIDVETRPRTSYRTRHLLLEKDGEEPWRLLNDSNLPEQDPLESADAFRRMVARLFSAR
jgi:hypothetical protein